MPFRKLETVLSHFIRNVNYLVWSDPSRTNGHLAFKNLFAAGIILAHQDWTRMKCGSGLSIATAYGAVKSLLSA